MSLRFVARVCLVMLVIASARRVAAEDALPERAFARLGSQSLRHGDHPTALAFSPDSKYLASGGTDGSLRIWDVATGKAIKVITKKGGLVQALAFSVDRLAVHFNDEKIRLYDLARWEEVESFPMAPVQKIQLTQDGKLLAGVGQNGRLLLAETGKGLDRMELPEGSTVIASPRGESVVVAGLKGGLEILEVPSGKPLAKKEDGGDEAPFVHGLFQADGKRLALATGGEKSRITLLNPSDLSVVKSWEGEGPIAFAGASQVVGRLQGQVAVWDLDTGKLVHRLGRDVDLLSVSPDGKLLATCSSVYGGSARIRLWKLADGSEVVFHSDDPGVVRALLPRSDDVLILTEKQLLRWKPGAAKEVVWTSDTPLTAAVLLHREEALIATSKQVYRLRVGAGGRPEPIEPALAGVTQVAATSDGKRIALGVGGDKPQLTLLENGQSRSWPVGAAPLGLAFRGDGQALAMIGRDGFIRYWELSKPEMPKEETWKVRMARSPLAGIGFSADGKTLIATSIVKINVMDAATGKSIAGFDRGWDDGPFTCLAIDPRFGMLAAGCRGTAGSAAIWDPLSRSQALHLQGATGSLHHVAFSPDGKVLYTAGMDENVLAWDMTGRRGGKKPGAAEVAMAWGKLIEPTADEAYPRMCLLCEATEDLAALLKKTGTEYKQTVSTIKGLVDQLSDRDFQTRESAQKELGRIGAAAVDYLSKNLDTLSLEGRERAQAIIDTFAKATTGFPDRRLYGEPIRMIRGMMILAAVSPQEADAVLKDLESIDGPIGEAARAIRQQIARKK